ncbi:ABC transporter permease [Pseudodesulfovibrio sediminis]|uniref:Spermidine/putrescine ABC transporter permease n=1 Tax=Pseudodesulfovibrio sediminis TaxID=2810563 RepID=A0ABN6ETT3_9BACT|nr:ABC transporter permease [Pseudodesulfovibrio sediminis]BCS89761.1 spermidine/putrescine ABC transporter permease [Pseudodesulfovibrio sediminis]
MRKTRSFFIPACALGTLAFLYVPLMAVASFSVNNSRFGLTWQGFTWKWYLELFRNEQILEAVWNTLILGFVSTIIATVVGTALAIGMSRFPWNKKTSAFFEFNLYMPVITPEIVFAGALVIAFATLRYVSSIFEPGLLNMIIGHVTFQVAFVALVVKSRLAAFNNEIEEASRDLYASNWYTMRKVILPMLTPGIVSGAMLAFTLSLDDFIISFFTAGPTSVTLPLYIYAEVHRGITPRIHALSTVGLLATILLVVISEKISNNSKKKENSHA